MKEKHFELIFRNYTFWCFHFQYYNNKIKGFILDTTWKILPLYVTSILAACFANMSIPIGYAFGTGKTKKLYNFLLKTIEEKLHFSFKSVILESDQGGRLLSLSIYYALVNLFQIIKRLSTNMNSLNLLVVEVYLIYKIQRVY